MTFQETKDWIEIIAGIGTFLAALISLYTLFEVRRQRESMYLPDVALQTFVAWVYNIPNNTDKNYKSFEYIVGPFNNKEKTVKGEKSPILNYNLENIGLGVAKSVKCKWNFDCQLAIKELEKILPSGLKIEHFKYNEVEFTAIKDDLEKFYVSISPKDLMNAQITDYILPESTNKNTKAHCIPQTVIKLYSLYSIFSIYDIVYGSELVFTKKEYYILNFDSFPRLSLDIEYLDVNRKTHKNSFHIDISLGNSMFNEEEDIIGIYYITSNPI